MIRQAISCDICGAEKRQTKHWFVAYSHADELRVSAWSADIRMRAGAKHLCGQTCLHKLLDDFIAATAPNRVPVSPDEPAISDASLTSSATYAAEGVPAAVPSAPVRPLQVMPGPVIAIAPSRTVEEPRAPQFPPAFDDAPNYASRHRRAEAWDRERQRCASQAVYRKTS
jgi:hypothetical protein